MVDGILESEEGEKVASDKVTIQDDGKIIDANGKKVKISRLEFKGETRGLPEPAEPVSAGVGESPESNDEN